MMTIMVQTISPTMWQVTVVGNSPAVVLTCFCVWQKNASIGFIQDQQSDPFFLFIAPPACSAPFTSAPQYKSQFAKEKAPRTKNYGVAGGKVPQMYYSLMKHVRSREGELGMGRGSRAE